MIDTHCHIDLYPDPEKVIRECDVNGIITIGMTNLPSHFEVGHEHLLSSTKCRLALGMHPLFSQYHKDEFPLFVRNLPRTSYVGEIGLDFSKEGFASKELQVSTFIKVLEQVSGKKKILSLHSRRAENEVLNLLTEYKIKSAIFHWYSGPLSLVAKIAELGYYLSVNSAMINSTAGQKIIREIPLDRLLTETDGPFIIVAGRPVRPIDIQSIERGIASLLNKRPEEISENVHRNFRSLLSSLK